MRIAGLIPGILMIISAVAGLCFIYYGDLIPALLLLVGVSLP